MFALFADANRVLSPFLVQGNNASPRQPMMNNQNNNRMRNPQQQQQQRSGAPLSARNSGEPIKFESEFDFEQANAKFEQEIEKEFDKLKINKSGNQNQVRGSPLALALAWRLDLTPPMNARTSRRCRSRTR